MRAAVVHEFGRPLTIDRLPIPAPGPGQVLIRIDSIDPDIPRLELRLAGKVTVSLLVLLGLGALAGGLALIARPDGSVMGFDLDLLAGSPFSDHGIPGLILGGLFGVPIAS